MAKLAQAFFVVSMLLISIAVAIKPDQHESCQTWAEAGECDKASNVETADLCIIGGETPFQRKASRPQHECGTKTMHSFFPFSTSSPRL